MTRQPANHGSSFQRADIQGLRGIAVLAVVIYHTGLTLKGGFAGVDVFFVISGFVITNSLIRQIESREPINLGRFYLKRVRRLLPGFLLVLATTVVLSFAFFDPYAEQPEIWSAALSGLMLSANLFFATIDSYDGLSDNPLRHLWSLGVEEHFYIFFPLLVYFLWRNPETSHAARISRLKRYLVFIFVASLALSLASHYLASSITRLLGFPELSQFAFERGRRLSFFFSPFRAWEILAGSLLATAQFKIEATKCRIRQSISIVGASTLMMCFILLESPESFPGFLALVPVVATLMLLSAGPQTLTGKALSSSPLTLLGDISYALYLWHWPAMVIVGRLFDDPRVSASISIPLSLGLAMISTAKFENKFRYGLWNVGAIAPLFVIIPLLIGAAQLVKQSSEFGKRFPKTESKADTFAAKYNCEASPTGWEDSCEFGDLRSSLSIYLFGDSNARSASDGLALIAEQNEWKLTISALSSCPVNFSEIQTSQDCRRVNEERLSLIKSEPPSVLVIVNHWTNYKHLPIYGPADQQVLSLETTLNILQELRVPVLIQNQIPICEFRNQLVQFRIFDGSAVQNSNCLANRNDSTLRLAIGKRVAGLVSQCDQAPCRVVDLTETLCFKLCLPFRNGVNIFADDSHISPSASRLTAPIYESSIRSILEN